MLSLRKANKLRVRLPLPKVTVASPSSESLRPFLDLIADEVNVKAVELSTDVDAYGKFELAVNARAAGPRLGKNVQTVIKAVKSGDWAEQADGTIVAAGIALQEGEYTSKLVAAEPDSTAALPGGAGLVVLDMAVTEDLEAEGWAKDRVRELQDARRAAGLDISDRIRLRLQVSAELEGWARTHADLIAGEVLAVELTIGEVGADGVDLGDGVRAALEKA